MDDRPAPPLSPEPVSGPRDGDLPAYLGNGLIGIRVREVPLFAGMVLVSGLAGAHPERGIEAAAAAPYPLSGEPGDRRGMDERTALGRRRSPTVLRLRDRRAPLRLHL